MEEDVTRKRLREIYEQVRGHLLAQNEKSLLSGGSCAYRGKEGRKCAAGCLIPDELYYPTMEGKSIEDLLDHNFQGTWSRSSGELDVAIYGDAVGVDRHRVRMLLGILQRLHDQNPPYDWPKLLDKIAEEHLI